MILFIGFLCRLATKLREPTGVTIVALLSPIEQAGDSQQW